MAIHDSVDTTLSWWARPMSRRLGLQLGVGGLAGGSFLDLFRLVREARAAGLRRAGALVLVDPDSELLLVTLLVKLSEAPGPSAPESAMATAAPPTIAAPSPRVTAPAPSQAYGWMRRCFDTDRLPRVVIQLP